MNDLAHKMARDWLENNFPFYRANIPSGEYAVEALANQMKFYHIEMTGGLTNRKIETEKRDIAVGRAVIWLNNHIPNKMNGTNDDWFIGELANELEAYAIDVNDEGTMPNKIDKTLADIKAKRDTIAKERDRLSEIIDDLENDMESFTMGIEEIDVGIEQIKNGLEYISGVV